MFAILAFSFLPENTTVFTTCKQGDIKGIHWMTET